MESVESVEQVLFNNYLFEDKIVKYLTDSDLKNFSETCKVANEISKHTIIQRKYEFFNSEYLKKFRVLYNECVDRTSDSILLINYLKLCDFFISKEYLKLIMFRKRPLFFENVIKLLDKALLRDDYYRPDLLKKTQEYSDIIQRIYSNC